MDALRNDVERQPKKFVMCPAIKWLPPSPRTASFADPVDREIRDFLAGKSNGGELFHALYDHVLDEPVPERLRALLRR